MGNPSGPPTALDSLLVNGVPTMGMSGGIPVTFGNYYFVDYDNGSDGYDGMTMDSAFKTIAQAYSVMTDQNDDVCLIRGSSDSNVLTAMLTVSKNRCHFVGLDGAWRPYGQGAKVELTATTGSTNVSAIKNLGSRNSFENLKIINSSTVTQSIYTVQEGGEYTLYRNCEIYLPTNLDATAAAEVALNGDSTVFEHCNIGSLADPIAGSSILRPCVNMTKGLVTSAYSGGVSRDVRFIDCVFWRKAKDTTNTFVYLSSVDDLERHMLFKGCGFINSEQASNLPAQAIKGAASLTKGYVTMDPLCYCSNVTKMSTTTGVFATGPASAAAAGVPTQAA